MLSKTHNPDHFFNRELSWLEFNHRVLEEAQDKSNPLLERLRFLCIVSSNLDEFFEIRVAGLKQQQQSQTGEIGPDGLSPAQQLSKISVRVRRLVQAQYRCWNTQIRPALEQEAIRFLTYGELTTRQKKYLETYFKKQMYPVLTPLGIDPGYPFPQLLNKSLNVIVELDGKNASTDLAIVQVSRMLPRVIPVPSDSDQQAFIFIGNILQHHVGTLFHGIEVKGVHQFRVTRNSDLYVDEEEADNLLRTIEGELRKLNRGNAVRLEVQKDCPPEISRRLLTIFDLKKEDLYTVDGPVNLTRLLPIVQQIGRPDLKFKPLVGMLASPGKESGSDIFGWIRQADRLLHHPFDSFQTVLDFIESAARDPAVLAIKQTLYRTGPNSLIVQALIEAARSKKHVTVIVELTARFDEEANIHWAKVLQEAGVTVVYGIVGMKTHGKLTLVVRREDQELRRYVHISTGNYHSSTARLYTDLGFFTAHEAITAEVAEVFNLLTGVSKFPHMEHLLISPFNLHAALLDLIRQETIHARNKKPSGIIAKLNALVDAEIIEALYEASIAGVPIRLIVRGICCLKPGVPGLSETIEVRSVVWRLLEHSRIYRFENAGNPKFFVSSADWMPRNFFRRVECCVPVYAEPLKTQLDMILKSYLRDDTKARILGADGKGNLHRKRSAKWNAQAEFIKEACRKEHPLIVRTTV